MFSYMGGQPQRRCRRPPREGHAPPSSSYPIRALRRHGAHSVGMCAQLVKKVLTSWWTGKQAPPHYHPLQFLLKSKRFSGAKTAGKRFFLWKMGFTKIAPCPRCIFALPESAMPTGVFRGIPENRRNQPLQFMAAGFVSCPAAAGGSRPCRPAAIGTGHCPVERAAAFSSFPEFFDSLSAFRRFTTPRPRQL